MKPERYKHKKTGGIYSVICNANIEKTGELVVVYQNEKTGERWVRPAAEFNDGRFEPVDQNPKCHLCDNSGMVTPSQRCICSF